MRQHRIQLGSRIKRRNESEYRPILTATCGDLVVEGDGELISPLLKQMLQRSEATIDDHVGVFRGDTPIFIEKATGSPFMPLSWYLDGRAYGIRPKDKQEEGA